MLQPLVLVHIFQESMQYMIMENQVHVTREIRRKKVLPNNTTIQKLCPDVDIVLLKNVGACSTMHSKQQKWESSTCDVKVFRL